MFCKIWSVIVGRIFTLHNADIANWIKIRDFLCNYYKLPEFSTGLNIARCVFSFSTRLDVKRDATGVSQVLCNRMVLETRHDR